LINDLELQMNISDVHSRKLSLQSQHYYVM